MKTVKYYGFAGHYILGYKCAYHLATNIDNKLLVSTVGHKLNPDLEKVNLDSYYETMLFEIEGEDNFGNPKIINIATPLSTVLSNDSREAEFEHYKLVKFYTNDEPVNLVH